MTKSGQRDTSDNRIVYFAPRGRPMLAGIRHKTILALGFVLLAVVMFLAGCSAKNTPKFAAG